MAKTCESVEETGLPQDFTGKGSGSEDRISYDLEPIDRAAVKRLLWKCDIHVLPMISILYMLAFLDRINIGNARIQGLEKDLHMKGHDYNIALLIFFIPYIFFEVPSNIIIRKIAPSTWLSFIMVCWGTVLNTPFCVKSSLMLRFQALSLFVWVSPKVTLGLLSVDVF